MHTLYLTEHPILLSEEWAFLIAAAGIFSVWCNYDCDRQRQEFRATHGKAKVWGKTPTFITAEYTTEDGQERTSLLLTSGWWGLSRHIHYIPEILASVFWCIPVQKTHMIAYFYPFYLTLLLLDRAWRDDARCADKYKQYWAEYCEIVPYKIIPGVV
jgi:7-dehydrocholesterol reductase